MDKLILRPKKAAAELRSNIIRIDEESAEILKQWQKATGLPICVIASKFIGFASEHTELDEG